MTVIAPLLLSLPTADRPRAHAFYRDGLGLEAVGPLADDGVPEPLVVVVNEQVRLMLIPTGGFGWVTEPHATAETGTSEVLLGISASDEEEVRAVVERARAAGASVVAEPEQKPWGYAGTFADPDGHLWAVTADGGVLA
jgi:predicted lactoylglutathione lyase